MRSSSPEESIIGMEKRGTGAGGMRKFVTVTVAFIALITTVLASTTPAFARKRHRRGVTKPSSTSTPTGGPQASITLNNGNVVLTNRNDFDWSILKDGSYTPGDPTGKIDWTVADTKTGPVNNLTVNGFVVVTNTGSANATIGNIVVNLQHRCSPKLTDWGSLSVDVADATNGDASTTDLIVAAASQEGTSKCKGSDYTSPSSGVGKFTENASSGTLEFTDASDNTVFSLVPQKILTPGQTVTLLYQANFSISLPVGTAVRTETIVSFGNAGARGGSGASWPNLDIDGSGSVACPGNECWARSVPTRTSLPITAVVTCNNSVTLTDLLTDDNPAASGDATFDSSTFTTDIGGGSGTQSVNSTNTMPPFNVSLGGVSGGENGGEIVNCANLDSADVIQQIQVGTNPVTGAPINEPYLICKGVKEQSCSDISIPGTNGPPNPPFGNFCTWPQSQWVHKAKSELETGFPTIYPSGVTVGGTKTMHFSSAAKVEKYLPAGGTNGPLDANLVDPTSSSSGTFGGDVLALQLNVDFNPGFGNLTLCSLNSNEADFNGMTVNQVLAAENAILGGAAFFPTGNPGSYNGFDNLATHLNVAFEGNIVAGVPDCHPTGFALNHLVDGDCPVAPPAP